MSSLVKILIFLFFGLSSMAAHEKFFFEYLEDERDVPFHGEPGELTRLSMIKEMGQKHPVMDCTHQCRGTTPYKAEACRLGLLGATYLLTGFQHKTGRSKIGIWQTPNSALTVGAYAFMKEREAGVSCEESKYIKRFPTRAARTKESPPPITHLDVCKAWNAFYEISRGPAKVRQTMPIPETAVAKQGDIDRVKQWMRDEERFEKAQELLWEAHTKAILHSYWQYRDVLSWGPHTGVPNDEYELWMGWNRIVGHWIPQQNYNSCVEGAEFLAYTLMPDCLMGTVKGNGEACDGTTPPGSGLLVSIQALGFDLAQGTYRTRNFDQAINAFLTTLPASPYDIYKSGVEKIKSKVTE